MGPKQSQMLWCEEAGGSGLLLAAEEDAHLSSVFPSETWGGELLCNSQALSFSNFLQLEFLSHRHHLPNLKGLIFLGMVAHVCNSSTWEIVQDHTWLHSRFEASPGLHKTLSQNSPGTWQDC